MNVGIVKLLIGPKTEHSFTSTSKEIIGVLVTACISADVEYHIYKLKSGGWKLVYFVTDALDEEFRKYVKKYESVVKQIV